MIGSTRRSSPWFAVVAAASLAPLAGAQSADVWPEITLSSAFRLQDAGKPSIPSRPREDLQAQPGDIFQAKPVEIKAGELREEQPVGEYEQPQWTTFRRFPLTRVYLQTPPGGVQFEQWFEFRKDKTGGSVDETRLRQELEFGLGHGLQLDLYMRESHFRDGQDSTFDWTGYSTEIRWAPWDWDEVFGNPTAYFEYIFQDLDYDKIEPKLLFGGEITTGWHWGSNLIYERTLAGEDRRTEEESVTFSISRTIVDEFFSAGVSAAYNYESSPAPSATEHRDRTHEVYLGPSFQLIPTPRASIDFEPLWGLTGESHRYKIFVVFTWHF